jgi:hypothetical protein
MLLQATLMAMLDSSANATGLLHRPLRSEELVKVARSRTG